MKPKTGSPYQPKPFHNRHWLADETSYTEKELGELITLQSLRAKSNLLYPPLSPLDPNDEQSLQTVNDESWLWPASQKPRKMIQREQFHIRPIDGQLLQWPSLSKLMRQVGDYLLLRNSELPESQLNDPMNFAFMDIVGVLENLSQTSEIKHVTDQMEKLAGYFLNLQISLST